MKTFSLLMVLLSAITFNVHASSSELLNRAVTAAKNKISKSSLDSQFKIRLVQELTSLLKQKRIVFASAPGSINVSPAYLEALGVMTENRPGEFIYLDQRARKLDSVALSSALIRAVSYHLVSPALGRDEDFSDELLASMNEKRREIDAAIKHGVYLRKDTLRADQLVEFLSAPYLEDDASCLKVLKDATKCSQLRISAIQNFLQSVPDNIAAENTREIAKKVYEVIAESALLSGGAYNAYKTYFLGQGFEVRIKTLIEDAGFVYRGLEFSSIYCRKERRVFAGCTAANSTQLNELFD